MHPSARQALSAVDLHWQPPTLRDFSHTLTLPAGPSEGLPYDPSSDPVQSWLIDQMDSGHWRRIYVCAPPQVGGKTQVLVLLPSMHAAIACRRPVGYGLPTLEALDKAWEEKLKPSIIGGGYGGHLPTSGPGSRGGRGPALVFVNPKTGKREGRLVFLAGGAYGSTVSVVVVDEVDQLRAADGTPLWQDLEDMFHRADSYGAKALRIATGTIEHDTRSIIYPAASGETGATGTRPWSRCPECGAHWLLTTAQLRYDPSDEEAVEQSARIVCVECGILLDEQGRQEAIAKPLFVHRGQTVEGGAIMGDAPRTRSLGLIWNAYQSSLANLPELAVEHYRAHLALTNDGSHELMRKFRRYRECEVYKDDAEDSEAPAMVTRDWLAQKSAAGGFASMEGGREDEGDSWHVMQELPLWARNVAVGVDVQRGGQRAPGRLYWLIRGAGGGKRCIVGYGHTILAPKGRQPSASELHAGLSRLDAWLDDQAKRRHWPAIIARGVDVGDREVEIVAWLRGHDRWSPAMGHETARPLKVDPNYRLRGKSRKKPESRRDREGIGHWRWHEPERGRGYWRLLIPVHSVRRDIHRRLLLPPDHPETYALPSGLERRATVILHLCATAEIPDGRGGQRWSQREPDRKHHPEWQVRKDLLDCAEIAEACAICAGGVQSAGTGGGRSSGSGFNTGAGAVAAGGGQHDWLIQ